VRTSAADALAQLDVKAMPNFNQASYAKAMLAVAAAAVDAEVARANRENQSAAPQVVKPALESVKAALAKGGAPTGPVDEALAQLADKQAMPPAELATLKQKFGSAPASGNPSGTAVPPEFQ